MTIYQWASICALVVATSTSGWAAVVLTIPAMFFIVLAGREFDRSNKTGDSE